MKAVETPTPTPVVQRRVVAQHVRDTPPRASVVPAEDRLRALDGLRMVAALTVCLFHYVGKMQASHVWGFNPRDAFPALSSFAVYGCLGVQLFFVISGFVICMSCWGRTIGDFFRSRVSRLYPAYWVAILITATACALAPDIISPLHFDEVLLNFTMFQQPMGARRVLGVCWTLWVEARFYLLFGLFVVWRGLTYRRVVTFCLLWMVACPLARVANMPLISELVMRDHAPFFIAGLALYLIHRFGNDLLCWGIVGMCFLMGQRYQMSALATSGGAHETLRSPYFIELGVALIFVVMSAVALGWLRRANWGWLSIAGALTYPFYLLHEHMGWFAIHLFSKTLHFPPWLTLASSIALMLGAAWLIHRFVERPTGTWLRRTLARQAGRFREAAPVAVGPRAIS